MDIKTAIRRMTCELIDELDHSPADVRRIFVDYDETCLAVYARVDIKFEGAGSLVYKDVRISQDVLRMHDGVEALKSAARYLAGRVTAVHEMATYGRLGQ